MEGSWTYDVVVDDIEVEINEVVEEDVFDDEYVYIEYDVFIEDMVEGNA